MRTLWLFFKRFLAHRRPLVAGLLCVPAMAACDIQLTLIVGDAIDRLRTEQSTDFLDRFLVLLLAVGLAQGVFRFFQRYLIVGVSRRVERELKQELFDKLTGLSLAFHTKARSGDVVSRLTSDVENVRMLLGPGLSMYVLSALVIVPGSLIVLFTLSPLLTLCMMVPLLLVTLTMKSFAPRLHERSMRVQESLADVSHRAQESFAGVRVVQGYSRGAHETERFAETSQRNREAQVSMATLRGLTQATIGVAHNLSFLPILLVGGMAMIDRSLAAGDLFKFVDLANKAFWPVIAIGWIAGLFPRALASAQRITELLDETSEIQEPEHPRDLIHPRGALTLERVGFTHEGSDEPALVDVSLELPAGSTLGVVGPTGSGKSTLLHVLGRMYEGRGEVKLDGISVRDLPLRTVRGALGYVPQDGFLFSETYRYNVGFGADEPLTDERVWELVELAGLKDEVAAFPGGLDQLIGERGVNLSGGQRQRTCIARALARGPRVLILDDALSAVDTETEARLLATLREAGEGRTVVVSAHRLTTVRHADQVLCLDVRGRVDALGTHAELLERSDWYRETWERQRMEAELEEL